MLSRPTKFCLAMSVAALRQQPVAAWSEPHRLGADLQHPAKEQWFRLKAMQAWPQEELLVRGRRFQAAPMPVYGEDLTPWEAERQHHDMMTGADIGAFGNAYPTSNPLGSDERNNETGGQFVAPFHNE